MSILDWWRGRGGSAANAQDRQRIDEAVERVVQTTNPKLRFARRYREWLAQPRLGLDKLLERGVLETRNRGTVEQDNPWRGVSYRGQ
jgi:hypothetical protein